MDKIKNDGKYSHINVPQFGLNDKCKKDYYDNFIFE
jgi:hypothetical protein